MTSKSVLLSGASGMLGSALLEKFVAQGWHVTALYRSHPVRISHSLISPIKLDIQNRSEVLGALSGRVFDAIVHCAASTNLEQCESDLPAAFLANVVGTKNLLDTIGAENSKTCKFVYISSDAVYPDIDGLKTEEVTPRPSSVYGLTKLWGEQVTSAYSQNSLILRTTIIGPDPGQFCSWIMNHAVEKMALPLFSDVWFSPISVGNLSEVICRSIEKNLSGVYNAGSLDLITKADFGKLFLSRAEKLCDLKLISLRSLPSKVRRNFNMSLDSGRIYRDLEIPGFTVLDSVGSVLRTMRGS
jgi:dTDP-4-dehydrorhamnose reductase